MVFASKVEHYGWRKGLWWGNYASNQDTEYSLDSMVLDNRGLLSLITKNIPKTNSINGQVMDWARGTIQKLEPIREYGIIEVIAKIRPSKGMWHAPLWFVAAGEGSKINVLPELDIAEVYSGSNENKAKCKSNVHYGYDYEDNAKSKGARYHYVPDFINRYISYALLWKEDKVEVWIDGYLRRRITDKKVLNRLKDGIIPIIGTGVKGKNKTEGRMDVLEFAIWKAKDLSCVAMFN